MRGAKRSIPSSLSFDNVFLTARQISKSIDAWFISGLDGFAN
jgi:hypothetical protein